MTLKTWTVSYGFADIYKFGGFLLYTLKNSTKLDFFLGEPIIHIG